MHLLAIFTADSTFQAHLQPYYLSFSIEFDFVTMTFLISFQQKLSLGLISVFFAHSKALQIRSFNFHLSLCDVFQIYLSHRLVTKNSKNIMAVR